MQDKESTLNVIEKRVALPQNPNILFHTTHHFLKDFFIQFHTTLALFTSRCFHSRETFPHAYTIHTPLMNLLLHPPLSTTPDGGFFHFHLSSSS
ncbi:hypothetical protein CEXT_98011 [Caerostris extrusa]|uniref:Uncharacterized protein n=1 Tax=Caerostris extrusa TaxID=172846 RepID=A0AAV4U8Q5_CAEEX|nr:hypothetical protein CEXT_98011 [Caerostris extrusa]